MAKQFLPHMGSLGLYAVFILLEGDILARMTDEAYMQRALELALQAEGNTSPNPMVGCVIVDAEGNIVGEGYHHKAGEPHAEVNALAEAKQMAQGATAYVTLEPCAHYGRTGPCCVALARAGIGKVVVACLDPNPKVAGQGLEYLRLQGIEVVTGVCEKEAKRLNERFFTWITKQRPFITLKYAMTLDGKSLLLPATANGLPARRHAPSRIVCVSSMTLCLSASAQCWRMTRS